jgi:homogentisate 1,2-dioxygenase
MQSEEMIYYVSGKFGSRKGVEVGSVTFTLRAFPTAHIRARPRSQSG